MANALKLVDRAQDETRNDAAARRLRGLIAEGRLNASEIARQVGLTQAAMSRRTTGFTPMTLDEFAAICEAGGFNIVYVLTGEGGKTSPHPAGPNGGVIKPTNGYSSARTRGTVIVLPQVTGLGVAPLRRCA